MASNPHLLVPTGIDFRRQGGYERIFFQRVHAGQVEVMIRLAVFFSRRPIGIVVRYQFVALVLEPGEALVTVSCRWRCGPWSWSGGIVFALLAHKCKLGGAKYTNIIYLACLNC